MKSNLVFLHGFLGDKNFEFNFLKENLKDKFNIHVIDLYKSNSFTLPQLSEFLFEELKRLQITKAHFWGYSMGGRVLLEFYKKFPDFCQTLILESTSLGLTDDKERLERIKNDETWAKLMDESPDQFLDKWYSQKLFESFKKSPYFAQYLPERKATLLKLLSENKAQKVILEASPGKNPSHFELIENIKAPTLVLLGEKDEKYVQNWAKLIDKSPYIAIHIVSNAGHVLHLENPIKALELFLNFQKVDF